MPISTRLIVRRWLRRVHLVLGLALGLVLIAVAGSGAALVFRDEIRALDPVARELATAWDGTGDMGFSAARDLARAHRPDHTLELLWFPNEARPYYEAAYLSPDGQNFVGYFRFHPSSGVELPQSNSPVLEWIEHFHVNLHLGEFGAFLVNWCTLLFSLILLTGLYLWWPGMKPHLWLAIRRGKLRLWDAHRVLGFCATIPLLVMMFSGVVFVFPLAQQAIYLATGKLPPDSAGVDLYALKSSVPTTATERAAPVSDEALLARAIEISPPDAFIFYLTFPVAPDETRQVRLQRGYHPFPYGEVHRVFFDQYTGEVLGHLRPDGSLAGRYLAVVNSELHYGTFGGLFTKILWFGACSLVPFFAVTGVLLWRRRSRGQRRRSASGGTA